MVRVKVRDVYLKMDERCLEKSLHPENYFTLNRSSLRGMCDNSTGGRFENKKIFNDLARSLREVEKEKLTEEGEVITNKLEGTTTQTRLGGEMGDSVLEPMQVGGGKYISRKKGPTKAKKSTTKHGKMCIGSCCLVVGHKKKKYKSKKKAVGKTKKRKGKKRGAGHVKVVHLGKHHYKQNNVFRRHKG